MQVDCEMKKAGAEQSENPKWYFSFGQMMVPGIIRDVAGDPNLEPEHENAVLEGYRLVVQTLGHIPEVPREILRRAWGDEFRSYAIVPDENSCVVGTIWPTNAVQRARIKKWELIMEGWFEDIDRIYVKAGKSRLLCCTECLPETQRCSNDVPVLGDTQYSFEELPLFLDPEAAAAHAKSVL